jgi:hypothetical protein
VTERLLRAWGLAVATGLGAVSAGYEAFLTPLTLRWTSGGQLHTARLPVALVLAVAGNLALVWFTHLVAGRVVAVLLPAAGWTVVMMVAANRTAAGDLVLTGNNWVGLVTLFVGVLAYAVGAYRLVLRGAGAPGVTDRAGTGANGPPFGTKMPESARVRRERGVPR